MSARQIWEQMFRVDSDREEEVLRGRSYLRVAYMLFAASLFVIAGAWVHEDPAMFWSQVGLAFQLQLFLGLSILWTRQGRVAAGASLAALQMWFILAALLWRVGEFRNFGWHFVTAVALAGFTFRPRRVLAVAALVFVTVMVAWRWIPLSEPTNPGKIPSFLILLAFLTAVIAVISQVSDAVLTALRASNEKLRQSNEALTKANEVASQANQAKTTLLNNVSHELRTPLSTILGYTELLEETRAFGEDVSPEELDASLSHIRGASEHLLRSIEALLNYTELESSAPELRFEEVRPRELLEQLSRGHREEHPELEVRLLGEEIVVRTDPGLLRRALTPLLSNAFKFTRSGHIELSVFGDPEGVFLGIEDTGSGMAPEDVRQVFEPLTQADGSLTRAHQGFGIGLTLARRFAEHLGGRLEVDSVLGEGTKVRLWLPHAS